MNISQLSAFHAVMTSATLTEAADRLGRTQPAISAAIRSLEDQLGMKLFERRGRKLVPVPEAQYLMTEANAILRQLSQVRHTMRGLGDGHLGTLTVAAMPGPVTMLFPRFIATHIGKRTGIKTSMLARSSSQIAELARAQSIDFGFADIPEDADGGGLYRSDVISGNCFVALPATHALAREPAISLDALGGQPMGSLQANHVHTRDVRRAFDDAGHKFNPMVESQTFLPILPFIVAGHC
ncbi:MAG: LysR family transcriptional regulator, partial [Boseongicola sp.]|nr:LysR family transcriptional regulator [Boseongicola sp.]